MSVIYKVNAKEGLNVRTGPGTNSPKAGSAMAFNTTVKSEGIIQNGWVQISAPIAGWVSATYVTKISTEEPKPSTSTPPPTPMASTENIDVVGAGGRTITGSEISGYKTLFFRYSRAFGCPPQFNINIDIQYIDDIAPGIGRVFASTMLSHPSILSICPGSVNYLPGFSKDQKNTFYEKVVGMVSGDGPLKSKIMGDEDNNILNGKLYEFKNGNREYMNVVNMLCRMTAILMGIGDEKIPFGSQKLKNFDYAWWTTPENASMPNSPSIFGDMLGGTKQMVNSAVGDDSYVHFFITNQGTSVSEDISTSVTSSALEDTFNNSNLNSISRNLEFLFGGPIGSISDSDLEADMQAIFANNNSSFIKSTAGLTKNYFKGGRLVFPQMIDGMNYSKGISCGLKFVSLYGDKLSIFLRCMVPVMHLLAFTLPKQLSQNMYTYPFIVRVFQKGWFNSDLAIISNLNIQRGGQDNSSWTVDGLPTEIDVTFDVTPLYSELMVSSTTKPFLAMQNTALVEYLGTLCGVDLKANNLQAKMDIAKAAISNKFTDIPSNLSRGVTDRLSDVIGRIIQIQNR